MFKNKTFIKANLIQLCFQVVHLGAIFLIGMYLQVGIGMSAIMAGLIMGMQAFGAMAVSRYSMTLFKRYNNVKQPVTWGLIGLAILSPAILLINQPTMIIFSLILFFIRGLFSGLCGAPIQILSVMNFAKQELGQVNSIFNMGRQVSISLGIALFSMLIAFGLKVNHINTQSISNYHLAFHVFIWGFIILSIISLIGIYVVQKEI